MCNGKALTDLIEIDGYDEYELAEMYDALNRHLGKQESRGYKFLNNDAGVRTLKRRVSSLLSRTDSFKGVEAYRTESDYLEVSGQKTALYDAMRLYDHEATCLEIQLIAGGTDWANTLSRRFHASADWFHSKTVMMGTNPERERMNVLGSRIEKMQQLSNDYAGMPSNVIILDRYRH